MAAHRFPLQKSFILINNDQKSSEIWAPERPALFFNHQVDPSRSDWTVLDARRWSFANHNNEGEMESFLLGLKWTGRQHSFRGTILLLFLRTAPSHLVVSEKVVLQNFDYAVTVSGYWRSPCFLMCGFARSGFQQSSVLLTAIACKTRASFAWCVT